MSTPPRAGGRPRRQRPGAASGPPRGRPRAPGDLVGTRLELDVERVAPGGHCVARSEGRVVFVRHTLPGERVLAVVTEGGSASRFLRADAVEVLRPAAGRVEPPCPYARPGRCGGCDWQHADLTTQRALKAEVVAEQLRRLGGVERAVVVEPVPGDADGLGWRTRVRFAVDASNRLALHRHRSADLVAVDTCLIAAPAIDDLGLTAHRWPGLTSAEAVASGAGDRSVVVEAADAGVVPEVPQLHRDVSVVVAGERGGGGGGKVVRGRDWVRERAAGRIWRVSAGGFWQVHPGAAETLVEAVLSGVDVRPGDTVLDLYAGVGLFAGALAQRVLPGGTVVAVEADARAVGDARRNLRDAPHVAIVPGSVERVLAGRHEGADRVARVPAQVDVVVLDPPRSGAGRAVVEAVVGRVPRVVAYVACDPAALSRDVATFAALGYELDALRAFDLFPMTQHVECVAMLRPAEASRASR